MTSHLSTGIASTLSYLESILLCKTKKSSCHPGLTICTLRKKIKFSFRAQIHPLSKIFLCPLSHHCSLSQKPHQSVITPKRYIYNSFIYKKRFIIINKKIRKVVVIKIKKKAGEGPKAPGGGEQTMMKSQESIPRGMTTHYEYYCYQRKK